MNRLRILRKEKRLTLIELSSLIHINKTSIARYETGEVEMKADTLKTFASFFNVSTDYLLGKTNDRTPVESTPSSPKDQLKGVKLALYDQVEDLTDDQAQQVLDIIKIIKKDQK